ncbi:MerR family transcriptional regulator [Actinomycetospora sp. NBRC 106375]|uniref:TOBE domain-containing protein n=1 Tax=Actinomycetospora sp. NBRC 106375 TaxID=3032207 RepID=UPI0024A5DE1C|nr:TOBE domain-containing protein [Actinomycetospora sp. NBRC 106375]GLZ48397.1 MerR family transcriptional regulator [Actinomycetospora sp. NBRC 106375]
MPTYRIAEAANLLGISDDTMRRLAESEGVTTLDASGRRVVDGEVLAKLAQRRAHQVEDPSGVNRSARNRLVGLVTDVVTDTVMAQVEMQCGPARIVSLMSTEAVQELDLKVGDLAIAVIKSTMVSVETPRSGR